ncbi:MAG: hypothetical protein K2L96_08560 [Muribaculaceae bacterium]|nr:hypothetical protein [Muribaculaceae bacterium]
MNYNERNAHARDSRLLFDADTHSYFVRMADDTLQPCDSVTTIVDGLFEPFDAEYWAKRKATPTRTAEDIMREWAENGLLASKLGTALHDNIERHYLGLETTEDMSGDKAFGHFLRFAAGRTLMPFRSEWRIFSERFRVAGTLDFLAMDESGYHLWDWKRSSKVVKDGRVVREAFGHKCGLRPEVAHIEDTSFWHYALQLSLYRYILETEYGIEVLDAHLGVFHPNYECPYVVEVPYLRHEAAAILEGRL